MKRTGFNKNWEFTFENSIDTFNVFGFEKYGEAAGAPSRFYDNSNWQKIDLPHDWALDLKRSPDANTNAGGYPTSHHHRNTPERHLNIDEIYNIGWYRKNFVPSSELEGKRVFVEFEGVFRDATVWINGVYLDRHNSGYTSFVIEITDHLIFGEDNSIAVRVDSDQTEGWWYEGAGIYRNVNLLVYEPVYFKYNKTFISTDLDGSVCARALLVNDTAKSVKKSVSFTVYNAEREIVAEHTRSVKVAPYSEKNVQATLKVSAPRLWSVDDPYLYTVMIKAGREAQSTKFGIRTVAFDADRGFLLNGTPLKIRGACVHQDFGGVGVALSDNLQYYKIKRLKEMGVNAYRCSHNAPSPVILDACDELGMLAMDETRAFGTSPEALRQLTDVIERDRNHPCVFIWSLGNEEHTAQDTPLGARILEKATRIAKQLDPSRPVTYGANNGPRFAGANSVAQVRGVNYIRIGAPTGQVWDTYHSEHPDQPIIGTEESSYVLSRGGAANDFENRTLDSFGNVTMPWGSTPKGWVKYIENRDYFSGAFMWTGFDYRGEPSPFIQNNSSSFGTIDLCGMEKPPFYYYKAWWTNEPVLKLAPHWNYTVGQTVTIAAYTNCESITLSLNGKVLQTRTVERFDAPMFSVVFEPGVLSVDGIYNGQHIHDELITSKDVKNIVCKEILAAQNDSDVAIYELAAYDENGVFCPLCSEDVEITAENGRIIGVGNGDPSSYDYERKPVKEEIKIITDIKDGEDTVVIPQKKPNEYVSRAQTHYTEQPTPFFDDDYRLLRTTVSGDKLTKTLTLTVDGVEGYDYIEIERLGGKSKVYHNGKLLGNNLRCNGTHGLTSNRPHRFYTDFSSGINVITVESEYTSVDLPIVSGQVKVGKVIDTPWHVKLHYGKARVFVKYTNKDTFALNIK